MYQVQKTNKKVVLPKNAMRMEEGALQWAFMARQASWRRWRLNWILKKEKELGKEQRVQLGNGEYTLFPLPNRDNPVCSPI